MLLEETVTKNHKSIERKIGNRIKEIRLEKRMSQEEVAFRSGLHRNYVSDVERGTRNASLRALEKNFTGIRGSN